MTPATPETPTILLASAKFSIHQRTVSGFDIPVPLFHRRNDNHGTWLYPADPDFPNAANYIYFRRDASARSSGFGGAIMKFPTPEGEVSLQGPWNSNSQALYTATGVDLRDRYLTRGIIALDSQHIDFGEALYTDVLHLDPSWTRGTYDRIRDLAQSYSNALGRDAVYAMISHGGGSMATVGPKTSIARKPIHD